jgi:hypothetical protein
MERSDRKPDAYTVGYGKPPKSGQFRKGQSGNRNAKKRDEENLISAFKRIAMKRVLINTGEDTRKVTLAEAVILKNLNTAGKNQQAMNNALRLAEEAGEFIDRTDPAQVGMPLLVPERINTIEEFLARHGRKPETE